MHWRAAEWGAIRTVLSSQLSACLAAAPLPQVIELLDATIEIPQLGVIRSLNVHVSGAIAMYEYTKQGLAG